jgi:hypothetical protein
MAGSAEGQLRSYGDGTPLPKSPSLVSAPCPVFGFLVELEVEPGAAEALWKSFTALAEERGLEADGGRGLRLWTFRLTGLSAQASDLDRRAVQAWASSQSGVRSVRIGDLFDIWDTA